MLNKYISWIMFQWNAISMWHLRVYLLVFKYCYQKKKKKKKRNCSCHALPEIGDVFDLVLQLLSNLLHFYMLSPFYVSFQILEVPSLFEQGSLVVKRQMLMQKEKYQSSPRSCCFWSKCFEIELGLELQLRSIKKKSLGICNNHNHISDPFDTLHSNLV